MYRHRRLLGELAAWGTLATLAALLAFPWPFLGEPLPRLVLGGVFASMLAGAALLYTYWRWRMRRQLLVGIVVSLPLVVTSIVSAMLIAPPAPEDLTPMFAAVGWLAVLPGLFVAVTLNRQLERYAPELKALEDLRERTQNWTDERWRREQVAGLRGEYEAASADLLHRWERDRGRRFLWQAVLATVFFGRNASQVSEMYRSEVEELRLRYEILIGRKMERRGVA